MTKPLMLQDLEQAVCHCGAEDCSNQELYFHGACHPGSPVAVSYKKGSGFLTISCAICDELIAEVKVSTEMECPYCVLLGMDGSLDKVKIPPVEKIIEDNSLENIQSDDPVREYEIWSEGFASAGGRGEAFLHGKMAGRSFNEACVRFFEIRDMEFRIGQDAEDTPIFNAKQLTYLGRRLFPTEEEARMGKRSNKEK